MASAAPPGITANQRLTTAAAPAPDQMIDALDQDYVLVAEAKGASRTRILWHHAFRNASVTTITVIGLEFGAVLAGAVVVEIVFSWPGLGRLAFEAMLKRDFSVLLGILLLSSLIVIVVNMLVDLLQAWLDPRQRTGRNRS